MISLTNRKTKLPQLHDSDNRKPKHSILSHGIGVDTIQRGQKKKKGLRRSKMRSFCLFHSFRPPGGRRLFPASKRRKKRMRAEIVKKRGMVLKKQNKRHTSSPTAVSLSPASAERASVGEFSSPVQRVFQSFAQEQRPQRPLLFLLPTPQTAASSPPLDLSSAQSLTESPPHTHTHTHTDTRTHTRALPPPPPPPVRPGNGSSTAAPASLVSVKSVSSPSTGPAFSNP